MPDKTDLDCTFELNQRLYRTDYETVCVLRTLVPAAKEAGDTSAVQAVLELGKQTGRIQELGLW